MGLIFAQSRSFMASFSLVLTFIFILIGVIGTMVPVLPGVVIAGLAVFLYAWAEGFATFGAGSLTAVLLITLVAGTADLWMPLLGAKVGGADMRTVLFGVVGSALGFVIGFIVPLLGSLIGAVVGYVGGIFYAEYRKYGDWQRAWQAGLGGLAGWLLSTAVQLTGALLILIIFIWQVW